MINNPRLPSGIMNSGGEIFVRDEEVFAMHNGSVKPYNELPFNIRKLYVELYMTDTNIRRGLDLMGIENEDDRIKKMVICNSGGFDKAPDFIDNRITREFWNCGEWSTCPGLGKVCKVPSGLSRKELLLSVDIFNGLPDKQVSANNGITHNTLRTHVKRINEKINAHCRADLVQWVKNHIAF